MAADVTRNRLAARMTAGENMGLAAERNRAALAAAKIVDDNKALAYVIERDSRAAKAELAWAAGV